MRIQRFVKLKEYEQIVYILRRHPLTFIPTAVLFIALLLIPVILYTLIRPVYGDFFSGPNVYPLMILGGSVYYLSIYLFFYAYFIDFYLDVWIITNKNLIDVEQLGVFHREISTTRLSRIQDINSEVKGFVPTFLNFGDITIQTAGSDRQFVIKGIENPISVRENLEKAISNYNQTLNQSTL